MIAGSGPARSQPDELRRLVPLLALTVAVVAAVADPSSPTDLVLVCVPVAALAIWTYVPGVPLPLVSIVGVVSVALAQRSGQLEPLMFEVSLLAFVVGRWSRSLRSAASLGAITASAPILARALQDSGELDVGIWMLGIAFPWVIARAAARQHELAGQLDATRRQLSEQAMLAERRRIARDVHDVVGHGVAAMMLQVTSARHVVRRDPSAAEEALRSAEEVGRGSMKELRRTVALLRSDEDPEVAAPLPSARELRTLVDRASAGGLAVELRTRGDLSRITPAVGVAIYRIAQEALANAARHAPRARTVLELELALGRASLVAETTGGAVAVSAADPERPRYGLIGMRERATALGGSFAAGPTPAGWRVSCVFSLDTEEQPDLGGKER